MRYLGENVPVKYVSFKMCLQDELVDYADSRVAAQNPRFMEFWILLFHRNFEIKITLFCRDPQEVKNIMTA